MPVTVLADTEAIVAFALYLQLFQFVLPADFAARK